MEKGENIKNKSRLAWTRSDFIKTGEEIPETLLLDDVHTEGELLSREEIDDWISDTYKTFCIVHEQSPELFGKLFAEFILDITYLHTLGKIDEKESKQLTDINNYHFWEII